MIKETDLQNRFPYRAVWGGIAAMFLAFGVGRFAYTPLLPLMREQTGLSLDLAGYLASLMYLGYLAGSSRRQEPWPVRSLYAVAGRSFHPCSGNLGNVGRRWVPVLGGRDVFYRRLIRCDFFCQHFLWFSGCSSPMEPVG